MKKSDILIKLKKGLRIFLAAILALVILVIVIVLCALISYSGHPKLTDSDKQSASVSDIWKKKTQPERARVIEDNGEALEERIRLINNAKDEIILSTFDFRADESGKLILAALIDASKRGVSVNVIVDGVSGFLRMRGNAYFEALASCENTSIKIYNKVNPLTPWTSMGRLHDKYLIADRSSYIIGGRNTFSYFLGDQSPYKNYDRDVLVYCENADENSSVNDVLNYFYKVWNYKESKDFISGLNYDLDNKENSNISSIENKKKKLADKTKVVEAANEMQDLYTAYYEEHKSKITNTEYVEETVPVNNIALLSNPIESSSKKPVVWYQLTELMKQAENTVKIHTPYIICNDYMYEGLKSICDSVENVSLMTNSIANNGNPFGAADYYVNKDKILGTGLKVWEYEGGYSYHGKSILIDDNISIIGSFNVDMRSAYLDTELMLVIDSEQINEQLSESMDLYEHSARLANSDGSYDNPYNVTPVEQSDYREKRMKLIKNFLLWARYLF